MRIYAVIDSASWCWSTTAREVAKRLPQHEFFFTSAPRVKEAAWFDLIWNRGYPYLFRNAAKAGVPMVWTFSTGGARAQAQIERCRQFLGAGATIVCQNAKTKVLLEAEGERRVVVIPNGVDTERFSPAAVPPDGFRVGMAANVNGERWANKGAEAVVAACRACGFDLAMATKPTSQHPPKAPEYDIGRLAHADMPYFLRGLSVFCQPSSAEGCSNSIMEAMACGLPCIICRESGYHGEVCIDGRSELRGDALFVRHGDADGVRAALEWLRKYPEDAWRIGQNARAFARRHSFDACARRYAAAFESAAGRATAFRLVTVATRGYEECLRSLLPSWAANSGAESIVVYSEEPVAGLPDGVENKIAQPAKDWIEGCMLKARILRDEAHSAIDGDRLVFLDADCAVLRDLRPFAVGEEDIALTRFSDDRSRHPRGAGTCSSGAIGINVNDRTRRFLGLWADAQAAYAAAGHGIRPGKVACEQYALTDLARGRACGVTIRAMDEHVWNNNPDLFDEAWLEDIRRHSPAVLHFKGGRWKDPDLAQRAVEAATQNIPWITGLLGPVNPTDRKRGDDADPA